MNTRTAQNHLEEFKGRLDSIYAAAQIYCPTHQDLVAQKKERIYDDPKLARCPSWVRQILAERDSCHFNFIQRHRLVWLFKQADGSSVTWEQLDDATRQSYCTADKTGQHYWIREKSPASLPKMGYRTGATFTREWEVTDRTF